MYSLDEFTPVTIQAVTLVSTAASAIGIKLADGKPRISATPYGYDVSEGNITNHTAIWKTGENPDVDAATEDMWPAGGTYIYPSSTGRQMFITSASESDAAAGAGARTLTLSYLDSGFNAYTTTVTLNGTTAVATVATNIARINGFRVLSAGTNYTADWEISIGTSTGRIFSQISSGYTRARNAVYSVPSDYTLYITSFSFSITNPSGGRSGTFCLKANYDDLSTADSGDGQMFFPYAEMGMQDGAHTISFDLPLRFPQKSDIRVTVKGDAGNADAICHCAYRGWVELT